MKKTVLYIEDEEDYQILVRKILGRAGYNIIATDTGESGLAALTSSLPDLLLLDINLPDANGYGLCERIRKDPTYDAMPILMLTVRRRPEEWLQGFSAGADDYLSKPFNPKELLERVVACVSGQTRQRLKPSGPEYQLIQAAIAGNRAAFEVLIRQYQEKLAATLMGMGYPLLEAEEIVSQAFVYAFEHLQEFRGEASFYTWMFHVARTMARKVRQRKGFISLDHLTGETGDYLPKSLQAQEPVLEALSDSEEVSLIPSAVRDVPQPYRKMLEMHVMEGIPYRTIARKMNVPQGTVMSRLSKARELLRVAYAARRDSLRG